ncbi:asparagine--tRNA ligase [bacterium]|nr:asparagine--tRNA ligase [bacterium]
MERVRIENLGDHVGKEIEVAGWLYNSRSSGKITFLLVRDGSGVVQCVVFKPDVGEELFELAKSFTQETSLLVQGTVREDKRAPGGYELNVTNLIKVGDSVDYPISPKEHGTTFLMDHRHLWLRSSRQHAILRIRHEIIHAIRDHFNNQGFINLDAPIFTPNAVEGTTTLFETDYFDTKAYLTQSGQLYMEAGAMAFGKVYCFGPTFRAEKSKTRRHLTEFWMLEPEVAYMTLEGDMNLAEGLITYIVERVLEKRQEELKTLERDQSLLERIISPFPRVHYKECCDILDEYAKAHPDEEEAQFTCGDDFGARHESIIVEKFDKPVMVHHFPAAIKAFYMKRDPQELDAVLGFDMLAPEGYGEIIGGSEREDDLETLRTRIKEHDLPEENFQWYLDLRRYGSVPHAGFGLGLERTVTWICGIHHLREAIPLPRMMHRISP